MLQFRYSSYNFLIPLLQLIVSVSEYTLLTLHTWLRVVWNCYNRKRKTFLRSQHFTTSFTENFQTGGYWCILGKRDTDMNLDCDYHCNKWSEQLPSMRQNSRIKRWLRGKTSSKVYWWMWYKYPLKTEDEF